MSLFYANGNQMRANKDNAFDEYYTSKSVANLCYERLKEVISKYDNLNSFYFLEPSVGDGSFYELLPFDRCIGIDIQKTSFQNIEADYLKYSLPKDKRLIVIGNPPFGHRGVLALEFINHSIGAEYVGFILPMFFQSVGKGSIRYRVKGFNLLDEIILPENSFYLKNGKEQKVKTCFQIWSKNHENKLLEYSWYNNKREQPFNSLLKVVTVSLAKNRECGKEWIFEKKANHYISSSFFGEIRTEKSFDKVKYQSGVAVIYQSDDKAKCKELDRIFENADWKKYSSLATNGCRHIGRSHIYRLLTDNGIKNEA